MRYSILLTEYKILVGKCGFLKSKTRFVVGYCFANNINELSQAGVMKGILIFVIHISDVASYQS